MTPCGSFCLPEPSFCHLWRKGWDQIVSKFASHFKVFCCGFYDIKRTEDKEETNRRDSLCLPSLFLFLLLCGQLKKWVNQLKKYQWAKNILPDQIPSAAMVSWGRTHIWLSVLWNTGISPCFDYSWVSSYHNEWGTEKAPCTQKFEKQCLELHPLALLWYVLNAEMKGPLVQRMGMSAFFPASHFSGCCQAWSWTVWGLEKYVLNLKDSHLLIPVVSLALGTQ